MGKFVKTIPGILLGIITLTWALPADAGSPSQISGFKVSVTNTHGLEVDYDLTAYATNLGASYLKAGAALDDSFTTVYTLFTDFGFGYSGTNYVVTFSSQEDWNTTVPPAISFGDGNFKPEFVLGLVPPLHDDGRKEGAKEAVLPPVTYRGSFSHAYPSAGTYAIGAQLTPDGDSGTPGLAMTGNSLAYPPSTGSAVVGTLMKSFNSVFRVARTLSPSNILTSAPGSGSTNFGPTVRYLANTSSTFTIDNLPGLDIFTPNDNANFGSTTNVELTAGSFDPEDGELTGLINWNSDIDGTLGIGGAVTTTLSPGVHTITATVTDSNSNVVFDQVTVTVSSGAPLLDATAGVCPGLVTLTVTGLSPGDKVAFFTGFAAGQTVLPGACAGAIIDLDFAELRSTRFADGAGEIVVNRFFPLQQCALMTQVINLGTAGSVCQTSNVLPTPVPPPISGIFQGTVPDKPNGD